jgi:RsiW-degrading membrane proteinase PrsW (M82 family)
MLLILLALAIAPGIAIAFFIYFRDKYEKEPFSLLAKCFLFGMFTIIPPIFIEMSGARFSPEFHRSSFDIIIYCFMFVGLSEELSKYLLLRVYPYRSKYFNEPFDGIVYSVMISMGFATAENIFYVLEHGVGVGILRMFTAVPAHAAFGVLMGFYVGLSKFRKHNFWLLLTGLLTATAAHGLYDYFLMQDDVPGLQVLSFVLLIIIIRLSFRAIKINRQSSPFKN